MTHFTDILTNLLAFAFALGVIIVVHEAGKVRRCGSSGCTLLVARRRRIHVDFCFHCRHRFTFSPGGG